MACRCQERRDAIRRAAKERTAKEAVKAARFVTRTMVQDAGALLRKAKGK